ncbi:BTB/POZ protein [Rhizophagus clarus]|uniref:BTB/POZ protein n=1 Tax=Rhizophagus clarus TaxID=94130 RepID=A0A8H3LNN7_9GLOM|nr:BTB/POZ protein [Rhizophagus clarus]
MFKQFFSSLSQNYIGILEDNEYYDTTIEVGKDPNVKIFRAHMIILYYRSPFLRRTLASNKKNNNDVLAHIKLSNISPEIFQIILKYLYGGIISLNDQEPLEILNVLVAADQLLLQELIDYLQEYLIENKSEWMQQYFELIYRTSFQSNSLLELQLYCTNFMANSPDKVFKSLDFISLSEKSLVSLIERDDLQMKEVEIWEHVLKWGLEKNPTLILDPTTWSDDDFKMMKNTLQHCLPLIRFFSLSSDEFIQKVRPYKKLLNHQLYEELLNSYLNSNSEPNDDNILLPRYKKVDGIVDTNIVNLNIVSLVSRWIDKIDINSKFAYARGLYLPKNDFKDPILSHVKHTDHALFYSKDFGPTFNNDIKIFVNEDNLKEYDNCWCIQDGYEKKIRNTEDNFFIEDYEVFQIIKKDD